MQITQQILDIIKSDSMIQSILIPEHLHVFGILLGGSRLFNLDTVNEMEISDVDLNIIVSQEDYEKLSKIPSRFYQKIRINNVRVHWYYLPVDFNSYKLVSTYYGLEFWISAILANFNTQDFFIIKNKDKISQFIKSVKKSFNKLCADFKLKYKNDPQFNPQTILNYLHKKSYYLLYIGLLLSSKLKDADSLSNIKEIKNICHIYRTEDVPHEKINISSYLLDFITDIYKNLIIWINN